MLAAAIGLIVAGLVLTFLLPFGWIVAIVGAILLVAYLFGFGRRAAEGRP
jgi:Flp pilus assembly protein TadB